MNVIPLFPRRARIRRGASGFARAFAFATRIAHAVEETLALAVCLGIAFAALLLIQGVFGR